MMPVQPTEPMQDQPTIASNLVLRPADGVVVTSSGRTIPQPPWIVADDPMSQVWYDRWLIEQGRAEALDLNETLILDRLDGLRAEELDTASRQLLSDFLFGLQEPKFEARAIEVVPPPDALPRALLTP